MFEPSDIFSLIVVIFVGIVLFILWYKYEYKKIEKERSEGTIDRLFRLKRGVVIIICIVFLLIVWLVFDVPIFSYI